MFETDSHDYEILIEASKEVALKQIPGAILEIGTRKGGSISLICDTLSTYGPPNRTIICVDPYGDIEYECSDTRSVFLDYSNQMRNATIPELYKHVTDMGFNFIFMNMEDTEFFNRFSDGVPVYQKEKHIIREYALAFIDGPHSTRAVEVETEFLIPKIPKGGFIVYDDISEYDHSIVEELILKYGFKQHTKTSYKASYFKG